MVTSLLTQKASKCLFLFIHFMDYSIWNYSSLRRFLYTGGTQGSKGRSCQASSLTGTSQLIPGACTKYVLHTLTAPLCETQHRIALVFYLFLTIFLIYKLFSTLPFHISLFSCYTHSFPHHYQVFYLIKLPSTIYKNSSLSHW